VRLFLVGMAVALAELPPMEWAALMLSDRFEVTAGQAGLGFVAVAVGMLVGRLIGDHLTDRWGLEATRRGGAALAATGVTMATLLPQPAAAGFGLFVAGLGLSSLFPLLFRAASELTHGSHGGMAAFSSGARLGFLFVSPLMGIVAQRTSVAAAMLTISGTAAVAVAVSRLPRAAEAELTPAGV
jgi:MFS family permease